MQTPKRRAPSLTFIEHPPCLRCRRRMALKTIRAISMGVDQRTFHCAECKLDDSMLVNLPR